MQIGGGPPFFMHSLKGGGGGGGHIKICHRFASKNVKSCIWMPSTNTAYQNNFMKTTFINTYKSVSYNNDLLSTVNITNTTIITVVVIGI